MDKRYLTTTEAARLLSVSPDTVLKWVRAGKVNSYRTPGGHWRIPAEAVDRLLPGGRPTRASARANPEESYQYCWEYNSLPGELCENCQQCIVYRSRARRCYEFRDFPEAFGHLRLYCQSTCEECQYYEVVKEQGVNVLVITRSSALAKRLSAAGSREGFRLEAAGSEYEASAKIETFRPDYIVVDCSFGTRRTNDICDHLFDDERIPLTRLILASKDPEVKKFCDHEILGWLKKPFDARQLRGFVESIDKPHLQP